MIEETIRQKLPEGFQRAEYLLDKGMVDMVVDRRQLKATLSLLLSVLMHKQAGAVLAESEVMELTEAEETPAKAKRKSAAKPACSRVEPAAITAGWRKVRLAHGKSDVVAW